MEENETDISAEQGKTGENAWIFKTDVKQAGPKNCQQAPGKRKETVDGLIFVLNSKDTMIRWNSRLN